MSPARRLSLKKMRLGKGVGIAVLMAGTALSAFLIWYGQIPRWKAPADDRYPIQGIDVSYYQGEIDWQEMVHQDISFAFIKATEGSLYTDPCFEKNWEQACLTGLSCGAYHFFSFDSPGETQAKHFIQTVGSLEGRLPPVLDVELYGPYFGSPPARGEVQFQLKILIEMLTEEYGRAPILYATQKAYRLYLQDAFPECDIWIRDVYLSPRLPDGRDWTFWQFSDRGQLKGYSGDEKHIDMNVFAGSTEEFQFYLEHNAVKNP